jgi:hypothetical protein
MYQDLISLGERTGSYATLEARVLDELRRCGADRAVPCRAVPRRAVPRRAAPCRAVRTGGDTSSAWRRSAFPEVASRITPPVRIDARFVDMAWYWARPSEDDISNEAHAEWAAAPLGLAEPLALASESVCAARPAPRSPAGPPALSGAVRAVGMTAFRRR